MNRAHNSAVSLRAVLALVTEAGSIILCRGSEVAERMVRSLSYIALLLYLPFHRCRAGSGELIPVSCDFSHFPTIVCGVL